MDILKQSDSFSGRISALGEPFRINFLMGELAYSTFDDFFQLADTIQSSIDLWEAEGRSEEQIAALLLQDDQVQLGVEQVFARLVMTADQYGYLTDEPAETSREYCRAATRALQDLEVICQDLGLKQLYHEQLAYYGKGAKHHLEFGDYLESVYHQRAAADLRQSGAVSKRIKTADYSDILQPREYVSRAIFQQEATVAVSKTLPGIILDPQDFDPPKQKAEPEIPLKKVSDSPVVASSAQLSLRHDTEIGLGAAANQLASLHTKVVVPPHAPLPEITEEIELPQQEGHFDDLEETTIVSAPEGLNEEIPPMPPAPELLEPSAALAEEPAVPGEGQPEIQPEKSEIEVYVSQKEHGPRAMAHTEPDPFPAVKTDSDIPQQATKRVVMDPIAPPSDLILPSAYRPRSNRPEPRQPEVIREDQAIIAPKNDETAQVQKKTRFKLWKWAAAATAAAGLAGLFGGLLSDRDDQSEQSDQRAAAASVTSSKSQQQPAEQTPTASQKQEQRETTQSEKGIYRVNTSHQAFGEYLCFMKDASGLVSVLQRAAADTRVHFFADSTERETAQKRYDHVLSGAESEAQQRIIVMKALLDVATQKSADNPWLVNYFKKQRAELDQFEQSGSWTHRGKSIGADRLFAAVQAPEKLTTTPNVIGYAPDIDPSSNPAMLKVKAGAPTFYRILQEVGTGMQAATEASQLSPYDDFRSVREATCRKVLEAGRASKDADTRAGINYLHKHWCCDECAPNNLLNQALRVPAIPVMAETAQPPAQQSSPSAEPTLDPSSLPTSAPEVQPRAPQQPATSPASAPEIEPAAPSPIHSRLEGQPSPWAESPAVAPQKKGFFGKALAGIKSFFGSPKASAQPLDMPATEATPQREQTATDATAAPPEFSKKDIPMYSWKETMKQFFWG